ncbi:MAG: 3-oxoacyl-[acyl-carrier-protein] reductase [SAR202 cluster bacterium]|nr:3-oxoacyl-[acyl-carrier-protein] reductase [SAR202 cluster bacterium]
MPKSDIEGKTALVTGAAKGIGRSSALRLAELGVRVAINYKTSKQQAEELAQTISGTGVDAFTVQADVGNLDQVRAMIDAVYQRFGKIDILVNNAGIIKDTLMLRMSDDDWHKVINTNLNGTFYCTRAVLRSMLKERWGRIINISSIVGIRGNPGQANYAASKGAINVFTKALAKEVATRNITVNAVTPGYINTETVNILSDDQKKRVLTHVPMGFFGEPDDVGHMVAYLATEKARYVTGQVISVDGGLAV